MGGRPPEGWRYAALHEIADIVSGGTPSRAVARYWGGSIPWATPTEVSRASVRYLDSTRESITEAGVRAAGLRILPPGSVLVTTRATIGAVVRARVPITTNQGFQNLVPHADTHAAWLFHAIDQAGPKLRSLAAGSTFKEVSRESFQKLQLLVAPLREQRAIAAVLDAVDDAIERSRTVIAVSEVLRQTLLHELLTRGIPGWHARFTHHQSIGPIPNLWQVLSVASLLQNIEAGRSPLCLTRPATATEWGVLKVAAVSWGEFRPEENKALGPAHRPDPADEVNPGDLLFSRANGSPDLVGRTVLVRDTRPRLLLSDKTLRLVPRIDRVHPTFLHLLLSSRRARARLVAGASRSTSMFNISQTDLLQLQVAVPPKAEQQYIVQFEEDLVARHRAETAALESLQSVRSVLGHALLGASLRTLSSATTATQL